MSICLRRREFIAGVCGAAAWPLAAHAQQRDRVRRIGVLLTGDENDPEYKTRLSAFIQSLAGFGWTNGRNVQMDLHYAGGDIRAGVGRKSGAGRRPLCRSFPAL